MDNEKPPKKPDGRGKSEGSRAGQFVKGYDPRRSNGSNPRRTKGGKTITSIAREFTEEALLFQVEVMRNEDVPWRERLKASEYIACRGWGAPKQSIEMTTTVEHEHVVSRINFAEMTLEARQNLLANIRTLPEPDLTEIEEAEYTITDRENDERD